MPFPATLSALLAAGYDNPQWAICPVCGLGVEIWTTPGKRTIAMEPTHSDSPVVRHYLTCNIAQKQEEQSGTEAAGRGDSEALGKDHQGDGNQQAEPRPEAQSTERTGGVSSADGSGIKLYGVTDPNHQLLLVGWLDGTLVCQFETAKWSYAGVPEAEAIKLKRSPYAYRIFTTNIKGKYPATKLE